MMLKNGNFEADWSSEQSHTCYVFDSDNQMTERQIDNIFTPPGWVFWFKHTPGTWDQPEGRDAWKQNDPRRVKSSNKAYMYFTFYRRHQAGLLQQVNVEKGRVYRFTAWAHTWSNHDSIPGGRPDDPYWSDGSLVGTRVVSLKPDDIPPLNGSAQNDANGNIMLMVGINPFGGVNPFSSDVKWSEPRYIYNGYVEELAIETKAEADTVTVFLFSATLWPFKHNDVYWDDASLTEVNGSGEPGLPPTPTSGGFPRIQYERTYVLLPPDADNNLVRDVADVVWPYDRMTIGGSADDAGIGALNIKSVIAISPQKWLGNLEEFFKTYYPGTRYIPVKYDNWYQLKGRLLAAILKLQGFEMAYPTTKLPPYVTSKFGVHRTTYYHNGLDLRSSWSVWKDYVKSATAGRVIASAVSKDWGEYVIVQSYTPTGEEVNIRYAHMVTGSRTVGVGAVVAVGDVLGKPDSTGTSSADHLHIDVKFRGAYADPEMLIEFPDSITPTPGPEPEEPEIGGRCLIGIHQQSRAQNDMEYIAAARPTVYKTVLSIENCQWVKGASPDTLTVYRQFVNNQGQYLQNPEAGAVAFINTFKDTLLRNAQYVDYVESLNEEIECGNTEKLARVVRFEIAFCAELERLGLPAKPVILCAPVGNPEHGAEVALMIPAVREAIRLGGAIGYHSYWMWLSDNSRDPWGADWVHYAGRALDSWDVTFRQNGLKPQYIFGEAGPYATAHHGWRSPQCLGGDVNLYAGQVNKFQQMLRAWNGKNGNRCLGATLFTTGGGNAWTSFETSGDSLTVLANALK